jgi:hypothetical protein
VFRLTHPGSEAIVFNAESVQLRDKWIQVFKEAVRLDTAAT